MEKHLYRSRTNKMFGGVAGGIAEYFDVDPVVIRIGFIATFFFWGFSGILYFVLWAIVPLGAKNVAFSESTVFDSEHGIREQPQCTVESRIKDRTVQILAFFLIVLGGLKTVDYFVPHFDFSIFFAILLVACGIGLILRRKPDNGD